MKKHKNTVVVAGVGSYNDLGVIRSCGEMGISVIYIAITERLIVPFHKSKYLKETYFISNTETDFLQALYEIINKESLPVVIFPTADITAKYIDDNNISLKGKCFFSHANGNLTDLMDKYQMGIMASQAGFTIPQSIKINLSKDVSSQFNFVSYPCILKPLKSVEGSKSDIIVVHDQLGLKKSIDHLQRLHYENILVQDYINKEMSEEIAITGVSLPNDEIIIKGQMKKIRGGTITVFGTYSPDIDINILENVKEYIKRTNYIGIFDIDILKNNNQHYFIECNFRNGAYGYAVTKAGFNMPYLFFYSSIYKKTPLVKRVRKVLFMEERSDFLNVLNKSVKMHLWLVDLMKTDVFMFFNRKDIRPLLRVPYFVKKHILKKK